MVKPEDPNRVLIFDTTLRDGEQSPGISLNTGEKLEIAQQLARLGVDVIEAGLPDHLAGRLRGRAGDRARRSRARSSRAWRAPTWRTSTPPTRRSSDAERPRIHTFISTSDIHIEHQLQTTREDVKGQARAAVAHAREYVRGRRVLADGRDPRRPRVHRRGVRDRHRGGRDDDQHPRHRRLHDARTSTPTYLRAAVRAGARARGRRRVGALPRRPRPGGRQLVRRRARRRAPGGVRDQRDRRARRATPRSRRS